MGRRELEKLMCNELCRLANQTEDLQTVGEAWYTMRDYIEEASDKKENA